MDRRIKYMDRKSIEKANELIRSKKCIDDLRNILAVPYPRIFSKDKRDRQTGFCYSNDYISFSNFDDTTRERLRSAIRSVIDERYNEIEEEIKKL